jgi:hypothetical protein
MANNNNEPNNVIRENLSTFLGATDIQAGIFFDNDAHKVQQVSSACGNIIRGVNVPETAGEFYEKYGGEMMNYLRSRLKDKKFFDYMASKYDGDYLDKVSGIGKKHIDQLMDWIEETKSVSRRAAIFDWDRTLTGFEGFPIEDYEELSYDHILAYVFGGDKRLEGFRNIFKLLHQNKIQIIILTNNGACGDPENVHNRLYFQEMVNDLFDGIPYTLICSRLPPFYGDKGKAIKADPRFSKCAAKGGRRHKQTKKHRKTRKQNGRIRNH